MKNREARLQAEARQYFDALEREERQSPKGPVLCLDYTGPALCFHASCMQKRIHMRPKS